MFKHNLISDASTGFYLYFEIATEPIMSETYRGVCCLFSEFTASHKWNFLLDIVQVHSFVGISLVAYSSNLLSYYFQVVKLLVH